MPETLWYYAKDEQQFGPVSAGELRELVAAGAVTPDDYLWREGMEEWAPAVTVKGLFATDLYPPVPQATGTTPPPGAANVATAREPLGGELPSIVVPPPLHADAAWFLSLTQAILWGICILVLLIGGMRFAVAFVAAKDLAEEQAACVVFATFCLTSYIIARAGEKITALIRESAARRQH